MPGRHDKVDHWKQPMDERNSVLGWSQFLLESSPGRRHANLGAFDELSHVDGDLLLLLLLLLAVSGHRLAAVDERVVLPFFPVEGTFEDGPGGSALFATGKDGEHVIHVDAGDADERLVVPEEVQSGV